ncbi:aminoglycoside phosphotransferase [Thalassococcus profundi]|uniref:Aminoglycoside phosphotransferase n=1 Tax=Thalassococcus profundi TaxID=2282382 RepID=A0A369THB3_9RHOB|nr:phosphotransferase [Thalassococcus profundi]RDD64683.1 aminoglycoside phosphotransferase [Thalassococcus profundi]
MTDDWMPTDWREATSTPLAGDASARRYWRLHRADGASAVLMHDPEGDVALFARLARHLTDLGLSAPTIIAETRGKLLIEDLGDAVFARLMNADPDCEFRLYSSAIEALAVLHDHPPPAGLDRADPARLAAMTDLAFDWYATRAGASKAKPNRAMRLMQDALDRHAPDTDVMILRDFHAENLIWLPDRSGAARAGLLDFQDALQGHRAYDLASLITDVRRDVSPDMHAALVRDYLDRTGLEAAPFRAALAVLGVQRNLRILGVFARLAATRGKPQYVDLIPRVWRHLSVGLSHPALAELAAELHRLLPDPTPDRLHKLRTPCPTP